MADQGAARQEPPPTATGGIIAFASTFCKGVERYLNPAAVLALAVGLPARCVVPYASVLACPFSTPVRVIFFALAQRNNSAKHKTAIETHE